MRLDWSASKSRSRLRVGRAGSEAEVQCGGRDRLGGISKQAAAYLRILFTVGVLAVVRYAKSIAPGIGLGLGTAGAATDHGRRVPLANRLARMAWAMAARKQRYREPATLAA